MPDYFSAHTELRRILLRPRKQVAIRFIPIQCFGLPLLVDARSFQLRDRVNPATEMSK